MTTGIRPLKVVTGICTAGVCAASALLVMHDPKPGGAPLRPPLDAQRQSQPALAIPPSCGKVSLGGTSTQTGTAQLSPAAHEALRQLQLATGDKAKQRQVLSTLSAADRQAVTAYVRRNGASAGGVCAGSGSGSPAPTPGNDIAAAVGDGTAITPVTNSYVS